MITIENFLNIYPQIKTGDLPKVLADDYPFMSENIDLYNDDGIIKEYMDTYIQKLNEWLVKSGYSLVNGKLDKGSKPIKDVPKAKTITKKPAAPKEKEQTAKTTAKKPIAKTKQPKPKFVKGQHLYWFDNDGSLITEKIVGISFKESIPMYQTTSAVRGKNWNYGEPEITTALKEKRMFLNPPATPIEKLPADVAYIKRYAAMHGKVKTREQVLVLLRSLQKAITERVVNKKSTYSNEIEQIQAQLIACYEKMGTSATIEIDAKQLEHYRSIVDGLEPMLSVTYLKQYISLHGKEGVKEKAALLAAHIRKAVDGGKIRKNDRYAEQLEQAYVTLVAYTDKTFSISQSELSGLQGLEGADGLGFIPEMLANAAGSLIALGIDRFTNKKKEATLQGGTMVSSVELAGMEFETLPLYGDYKQIIGTPSKNFTAMVYGSPGSGKTTWCIKFAKYLAEHHNMKALFATIEEGVNHTAQEKFKRLDAFHSNLSVADHLPENLSAFGAVFIDSVNSFRYSTDDLRTLRQKYPNMIIICIFQTTKEGKFKGSQEYEHDVDVVVRAENGTISTAGCKNRFGGNGEVRVW